MGPFKIKQTLTGFKISNEEDFRYIRNRYKVTSVVKGLIQDLDTPFVCNSPTLYNISSMKPLFQKKVLPFAEPVLKKDVRVFIVIPYVNPVLRGKILESCISLIKCYTPLFVLNGGVYGRNKDSTNTLMKRYLRVRGVKDQYINKFPYNNYPECISETLELLPFMVPPNQKINIVIGGASSELREIINFVKKINTRIQIQYVCEF
jgi:hypothetical protein